MVSLLTKWDSVSQVINCLRFCFSSVVGKTIQVLAFLFLLLEKQDIRGPHLIVTPLSVLSSWEQEINRFFEPCIAVYVHQGSRSERVDDFNTWKSKVLKYNRKGGHSEAKRVFVVLTSYDMAIKDNSLLRSVSTWQYLVVDEAHRLKNRSSVLFEDLMKIKTTHRLLLTGTPLQNNLTELWSLMSFILPEIFHDIEQLSDWFNRPFESEDSDDGSSVEANDHEDLVDNEEYSDEAKLSSKIQKKRKRKYKKNFRHDRSSESVSLEERGVIVSSLHKILKPFLLRRLKSNVLADVLLQRTERTLYCPLSGLQIKLQEMLRECVRDQEDDPTTALSSLSGTYRKKISFNNIVMQLRKLCNHPYQLLEDMKTIPDDLYDRYLVTSCGKLFVLKNLLRYLLTSNDTRKILIFSQMTTTLDIIQGFIQINFSDIEISRLDGSSNYEDRSVDVKKFHVDPLCRIFLLSTRAGGVGLNLQVADTVIMYDSDWNPQMDLQAISRVHRMGQVQEVLVIRLVSTMLDRSVPTIEERILKRASFKLKTEKTVIADGEYDMKASTSSAGDENTFKNVLKDDLIVDGRLKLSSLFDQHNPHQNQQQQEQEDILIAQVFNTQKIREQIVEICRREGDIDILSREHDQDLLRVEVDDDTLNDWHEWFHMDEQTRDPRPQLPPTSSQASRLYNDDLDEVTFSSSHVLSFVSL